MGHKILKQKMKKVKYFLFTNKKNEEKIREGKECQRDFSSFAILSTTYDCISNFFFFFAKKGKKGTN